jgi:hypothetical protein
MNVQGEKKKDLSYSEDEKRLKRNVVRQQERLDRMMQLALSGLITYMGMKVPRNDSDEK